MQRSTFSLSDISMRPLPIAYHVKILQQRMVLLLHMTFGTIEPFSACFEDLTVCSESGRGRAQQGDLIETWAFKICLLSDD